MLINPALSAPTLTGQNIFVLLGLDLMGAFFLLGNTPTSIRLRCYAWVAIDRHGKFRMFLLAKNMSFRQNRIVARCLMVNIRYIVSTGTLTHFDCCCYTQVRL